MLNIVIFGPPGAGKGTQSEKIIEKYNVVHISTGDLFRWHTKNDTPLGLKVKEIMNSGELVSDDITIAMLREEVEKNPQASGFLFDGFPRTVPQAEALDELMKSLGTEIHAVVELDVTEAEVRARIAKRKELEGRVDDADDKLEKRIQEYFNKTVHVLPFYKDQGRLSTVNGIGDIDGIFNSIAEVLDQHAS
ncbi:MAG: adenylate kinase [Flammeovirgaceae bacterium]|nr:adenylate kinase [Flammeovirgaceae bacterium]MBR11426.1 adenylate kinase [Rickettsiales bacterium]HCX25079.1 adenylate kinase [Cytophagales bacterium]|tara:strand:+ start:948 stop:1523 length:576 start_codon:yes stop_codon:yes gene_type:complete